MTPAQDPFGPEPVRGKLVPIVESLRAGRAFSRCDETAFHDMQVIAAALDERADQLDAYLHSLTATSGRPLFELGPIKVEKDDDSAKTKAPPSERWESDQFGWAEIASYYDYAMSNTNLSNWLVVNRLARGILSDDVTRIMGASAYAIGHVHEAMLKDLLQVSNDCRRTSDCTVPAFNAEETRWMLKQSRYSERLYTLRDAPRYSARWTTAFDALQAIIRQDAQRFAFVKNPSVQREGNRLILPLLAGPFAAVTAQFSALVEPIWTQDGGTNGLALKIAWRREPAADLYAALVGNAPGGRSFVSFTQKKMTLESGIRVRTIAHEVGHVLGFRDRYYTVWDADICQYTQEYRRGDLMADAGDGVVTAGDWATLSAIYPSP